MVDAARKKSVRRLDAQAAATAGALEMGDTSTQVQSSAAKKPRNWSCQGLQVEPSFDAPHDSREAGKDKYDATSGETLALMRAQAAIDGLTRGDICELRSFSKPPAAVNMATAAMMITLAGHGEPTAEGWQSAKRYMTNVDNFFAAVSGLDLNTLKAHQTRKLEAYARNPAFRPDIVACVSLPASKLCSWVLGVLVSEWEASVPNINSTLACLINVDYRAFAYFLDAGVW